MFSIFMKQHWYSIVRFCVPGGRFMCYKTLFQEVPMLTHSPFEMFVTQLLLCNSVPLLVRYRAVERAGSTSLLACGSSRGKKS